MAHVSSRIRDIAKPLLFKMLPESAYMLFQAYAKIRDIKYKMVEEVELELLPNLISADAISIDVGANYAYITHRLATLSPKGKVYAYEPIPAAHNTAKKIISYFKLKNVNLFPLAVGNENSEISFRVPLTDYGIASVGLSHCSSRNNDLPGRERYYNFNKEKIINCRQVRLDDHLLPMISRLDFVKIDIEGAEFFALQGMHEMLKKFQPIIYIELYPFYSSGFGIKDEQIFDFLSDLGYKFFYYQKSTKKLVPLKGNLIPANFILLNKINCERFSNIIDNTGGDGSLPFDLDSIKSDGTYV